MAAVDQLIALVTKTADKLNALNTAIGTKANIGVSSDVGNNLSVGSDNKPYFDSASIPLGVSTDANNSLELGTDNKPYLDPEIFVPSTRILNSGTGINTIGDLSENRSITLDFDYLDGRYGEGFKQRDAVVAATDSNITLSGLQTIDGVSLAAGARVLVRKQTNAAENGVYIASSTAWTRATDFDEPAIEEVTQGASVYVVGGTLLKGTGWTLQTAPPYVIGTTALHFIQYTGASNYAGGNHITIAGNLINHDTGAWVNKSNLSGAAVISNLSVDAYGHPTNWVTRNLTASDLGAISQTAADGRYVTLNTPQTINAFKYINPTSVPANTSAGIITIGGSGAGSFISSATGGGGSTSFTLRGYQASGIQLDLNEGGIIAGGMIQARSGSSGVPVLGSRSSSSLNLGGSSDVFGLNFTTNGNGHNYIQSQRFDGATTTYPILLNALGGDVGIGINGTPLDRLHINGHIRISGSGTGIGNTGYLSIYETNGVTRQGYIGFPTQSNSDLYIRNDVSGRDLRLQQNGTLIYNGSATFSSTVTATNFILSSDIRLKENIESIGNGYYTFNLKSDDTKTKRYGVLAHEVEEYAPELIIEGEDGFKKVAYIDLLIKKIAELEMRVKQL